MRSSFVSAAVLAFASAVFATDPTPGFDSITSPFQDENIPAGKPFEIVWQPSNNYAGTVTIQLLQGATPSTLSAADVIKAGIDSAVGKYTWDVPTSLKYFATYGFTITADTNTTCFQYSFPFHVTGLSGSSSSAAVDSGITSTVTMHLSTGSNYVAIPTTFSNSTTSAPTYNYTQSSNVTLSSTIARTTAKTTATTAATTTTTKATQTSATSSSAAPPPTTNAAVVQVATGSFALIGGLVLALAL